MASATFYPDSTDGFLTSNNADWPTCRAGSNLSADTTTAEPTTDVGVATSGYYAYEAFLDFDTSSIPDDATITSVTMYVCDYNGGISQYDTLEVRARDWGSSLTTGDWVAGADFGALTLLASRTGTWSYNVNGTALTSEAAFLSAINKSGRTLLVCASAQINSASTPSYNSIMGFPMSEHSTASRRPRLAVEWDEAPPSVTGTGGVTLGAAKIPTGAGIVYTVPTEIFDGDYSVWTFPVGESLLRLPVGWTSDMRAEVLVVGGGGGGDQGDNVAEGGGGGGAGGYVYDDSFELTDGMAITVGAGGAGGTSPTNGSNSILDSLTAYGGGHGLEHATDGASGGGMTASTGGDMAYGTATHGDQGHNGASSGVVAADTPASGGGGGGAVSAGSSGDAFYQSAGSGGAGGGGIANDITGTGVTYGVGGKGGDCQYGTSNVVNGDDGIDGRGNGGDGGNNGTGGAGGAGTVIIRFYTLINEMYVTLGSPRATGTGHVSAAYTGAGTSTLGAVRTTGSGRHPTVGSGRVEVAPVLIPLGISANTLYVFCDVKMYVAAGAGTMVTGLSANCRISVAGEEDVAWLRDTGEIVELEASCMIRVAERGDTLLNTGSLPATDGLGWTAPDRDAPALRGLVVTLNGKRVRRELIEDLVIDLSDRGGYDRAVLTLAKSVRVGQAAMLSTLRVTYENAVLFRGRLEARGPSLGHEMQHALTFTGPIVQLKDHRGFRRVYADSDLSSWQTGQGPNTAANVFEVQGS